MANNSKLIPGGTEGNASRLIQAIEMWGDTSNETPTGLFNRQAIIQVPNVVIKSKDLDFEFTIDFDDDVEPNEAEIIIYNLSDNTINQLKIDTSIDITAGYGDDTGVIFKGVINKVTSKFDGVDRITTITAFDDMSLKDKQIDSITYAEGTCASYILSDLLKRLPLNVAAFEPERDWEYENETTVDGDLTEAIKKYAEVCGISTYINRGQIYARNLTKGDNINFIVSSDTGLIGTPEEYSEEVTAEDYIDTIHGYKFDMLLQHRMTTAAIINLKSRNINGQFRVKKGQHIFNESEALTKLEVVDA